jgi:PIN domain nuclease of toxin-antitoxin system
MDAVTDTHGLIWYLQDDPQLGMQASKIFDACDTGELIIYVPTICVVEIIYLQEKGRIPADFKKQLNDALRSGVTGLVLFDLTGEVADAISQVPRNQVPDLPDRIVAATALHLGLPVISRDRKIQLSSIKSIW